MQMVRKIRHASPVRRVKSTRVAPLVPTNRQQRSEIRCLLQSNEKPKQRLKRLYAEVKETPIGKAFLAGKRGPKISWGVVSGDNIASFVDYKITLAKSMQLSDCKWKQVIAMELGNFYNSAEFIPIQKKCWKGNLCRKCFVQEIEIVEFSTRGRVIEAYKNGEFGIGCESMFTEGVSFDEYMNKDVTKEHYKGYEEYWDENCKKAYEKASQN